MVTDPEVLMKGIGKKINREMIDKTRDKSSVIGINKKRGLDITEFSI